ncbi:MAG: hypothetical protein FI687_07025 [SAR202 cluster bacterium]|nr:hypothetical protein [SAR202 cluster bacterium]
MIIDGHMYCFPELDSLAGYNTIEEKFYYIQQELGGHHQPVWKTSDKSKSDNSTLIDPKTNQFQKIKWRKSAGRLDWEFNGELYTKQYLPPMLENLNSTPEYMISEMDYAGVDMGIIHTSPHLGLLNQYLRNIVEKYPDRFIRLTSLEEKKIPTQIEKSINEIANEKRYTETMGFHFHTKNFYESGLSENWIGNTMREFWDAITSLNMPIFFSLGLKSKKNFEKIKFEDYIEEQNILLKWMELYPDIDVVITHGLPWRKFFVENHEKFPEEIWNVFKHPKCNLQLMLPIQIGNIFEYPWTETEEIISVCTEKIGANRLIWGTDMPLVGRFCTYKQALNQIKIHCNFLSNFDKLNILGQNIQRIMKLNIQEKN